MSMSKGGGDKELKGGDDKALPKNTYDFGYHRKDAMSSCFAEKSYRVLVRKMGNKYLMKVTRSQYSFCSDTHASRLVDSKCTPGKRIKNYSLSS